jgi:AcrR family transcriptional regulator
MGETSKRRQQGNESKERILDAASAIASERGYEGTSISLVSKRSGLPASSIYWHFQNKDELIAAVIERSFHRWVEDWTLSDGTANDPQSLHEQMVRRARTFESSLDFLRLGLMLALERRPEEPAARALFLSVRHATYERIVTTYRKTFDRISEPDARILATLTIAAADGLFIAHEIDPDAVDLPQQFDLLAVGLEAAAAHLGVTHGRTQRRARATKTPPKLSKRAPNRRAG